MKRSRSSSRYQLRARAAKKPLPIIEQDTASEGSLSEAEKLVNDELFIPDQITAISDESEPADTVDLDVPYEPHSDDAADEKASRRVVRRPRKAARPSSPKTKKSTDADADDDLDGIDLTGSEIFTADETTAIQQALLRWYFKSARSLPWRVPPRNPDDATLPPAPPPEKESAPGAPYAVWVSEVMSQQTRIEVVARFWKRWMQALPTVRALANAPLESVRELWAGLGYYRRAAALHAAAVEVVQNHDGELPGDVGSLRALPGVGVYTAGAVSSIAFGAREPAVDGNAARVLTRLRPALAARAVGSRASTDALAAAAQKLLAPPGHPADLVQAVMELGATVCKPRNAAMCGSCPLRAHCGTAAQADRTGIDAAVLAERLPIRTARKRVRVRAETVAAAVVCRMTHEGWRFLVCQRGKDGLLAGMWETPSTIMVDAKVGDVYDAIFNDIVCRCEAAGAGKLAVKWKKAGTVTHVFSHIRQTLVVRVAVVDAKAVVKKEEEEVYTKEKTGGKPKYMWVSADELTRKALSTQMLKVFKSAGKVIGEKFSRKV